MLKINKKMESLLSNKINSESEIIMQKAEEFCGKVFSTIKLIDERIVIVDYQNEIQQGKINYDWIKSIYGDLTGFEVSCNEMRLCDYIDVSDNLILPITNKILEKLKQKLKNSYPQFSFIIIVSINNEDAIIRFHMLRENEQGWLNENLDGYENAILTEII